jgi:penicillin-binding protein 5, C-terminal domain
MNKGEEKTLEKELVLQEGLQAPIQKGQQIGEVIIKQNGAELCRTAAVSAGDITQLNLMECVRRIAKWWIH